MKYRVTSPAEHLYLQSTFGGAVLDFQDSVATADDLNLGLLAYLEGAGYTVEPIDEPTDGTDGQPPTDGTDGQPPTEPPTEPIEPKAPAPRTRKAAAK